MLNELFDEHKNKLTPGDKYAGPNCYQDIFITNKVNTKDTIFVQREAACLANPLYWMKSSCKESFGVFYIVFRGDCLYTEELEKYTKYICEKYHLELLAKVDDNGCFHLAFKNLRDEPYPIYSQMQAIFVIYNLYRFSMEYRRTAEDVITPFLEKGYNILLLHLYTKWAECIKNSQNVNSRTHPSLTSNHVINFTLDDFIEENWKDSLIDFDETEVYLEKASPRHLWELSKCPPISTETLPKIYKRLSKLWDVC